MSSRWIAANKSDEPGCAYLSPHSLAWTAIAEPMLGYLDVRRDEMTMIIGGHRGAEANCPQLYRVGQSAPGTSVPVIASIPHSGTFVPPSIEAAFTQLQRKWLRNTHWHLPEVYDFLLPTSYFLPELGITRSRRHAVDTSPT
ncbi:hypothetical protein [Bradyrhizobium sp. ISRA426]|uniref:hypothetical protein n=1 Tax=Bradyrhizobium sp. ISRA426 TaxID=2866191 RepID=UPI0024787E1A|nr:hypothetical protein [Bradyrhizobium sp. ISRA426]WGR70341.1 hypothetical protein MTX24_33990 [Bradyrhizobium sp. ISRA426]